MALRLQVLRQRGARSKDVGRSRLIVLLRYEVCDLLLVLTRRLLLCRREGSHRTDLAEVRGCRRRDESVIVQM